MPKKDNPAPPLKLWWLILIAIVALFGGAAIWWYAYRVPTVTPNAALEEQTIPPDATVLAKGSFNRLDAVHQGSGQAAVYQLPSGEKILQLEDFSVTEGPDLYVYLSTESKLTSVNSPIGKSVSLGRLKSSNGTQRYTLPNNYPQYQSVVIWCRAFSVAFSFAPIK